MKTKEELRELKNQFEELSRKLAELNEDELRDVSGGVSAEFVRPVQQLVCPVIKECKFEGNTAKGDGGAIQFEEPQYFKTPFFEGEQNWSDN